MTLLATICFLAALAGSSQPTPVTVTELDRPFAQDSLLLVKQKRISPEKLKDVGFVRYTALLVRTLDGDTTVDYSRMRFWFTQTAKYDPFCLADGNRTCTFRDSLADAYTRKNWAKVREYANKILQREYIDIDAQTLASTANLALGDSTLGRLQGWTSRKLLESIRRSGDGTSAESAYKLISVLEERPFLAYSGYTKESVETTEFEGRIFDKVTVKKTGTPKSDLLWFDVTLPYLHLEQLPDSVKAKGIRHGKP